VAASVRASLSALENRQYRWLFASNLAFFLAMGAQQVVRSWLVFKLTDSKLALGMVMFAVAVPMFLIGPFGGVIADRRERRSLIIGGQTAVLLSELTIVTLLWTGSLQFWHLLATTTVMGCVFPFIMPARQAIVANIVGKNGLTNAIALNMAGMNATRVIGPALGGFLIGIVDVEGAYIFGIVLYASALLCMTGVTRSHPGETARDLSVARNLLEGVRYMGEHRLVLILLLFGLIPMFLAMPFQTLLVVFADEIWGVGSWGLGVLSGTAGVGGILGSMYVAWRSDSHRRARRMLGSMFGFGGFLLLFAICPWFLPALPLILLANVFASVYGTLNSTAIQLLIPDRVRGRVSSFLMMSFSVPLLGALPMGAIAEVWGAPAAVMLASTLATAIAMVFYVASPRLRDMDAAVRRGMLES
jgi:MFS family permease